jgi:hypothetical protein
VSSRRLRAILREPLVHFLAVGILLVAADRWRRGEPAPPPPAAAPAPASTGPSGPIVVGADVFIGAKAFVLPGVVIGDGAVVGAAAVVTRDVEPWTIVAGNPAKPIGQRVLRDKPAAATGGGT